MQGERRPGTSPIQSPLESCAKFGPWNCGPRIPFVFGHSSVDQSLVCIGERIVFIHPAVSIQLSQLVSKLRPVLRREPQCCFEYLGLGHARIIPMSRLSCQPWITGDRRCNYPHDGHYHFTIRDLNLVCLDPLVMVCLTVCQSRGDHAHVGCYDE